MLELLVISIPLLAVAVNVLVLPIGYRYVRGVGFMRSVLLGFGAGMAALFVMEIFRWIYGAGNPVDFGFQAVGDLVIYICLGYLFFNVINAGESSIRIRILRELRDSPHPLGEAELLGKYNDQVILNTRLERLLNNGQIVKTGERYFLRTRVLVLLAFIMITAKFIAVRRTSEFDPE